MGLVGNLAAQLARRQGGRLVAIDISEARLAMARACGIAHTIDSARENALDRVMAITNGAGVSSLIDATGNSRAILDSMPLIGKLGELILLGSPRGECQSDVTQALRFCHLYNQGCITFKGAHEFRFPKLTAPFVKHSFERNARIIWRMLEAGELEFERLITHIVSPVDAVAIYAGLRERPAEYMGVVFDWTTIR
ncbi:MAG: D-arabitol-phosphate dehydrogenase [candidate division BRC1 bacterium ADurb.BinA364]|nr:MAG: D-arabitol-phosphate dehydrogenase [candidate division BRC1 bacterium ADurb.BinA364]